MVLQRLSRCWWKHLFDYLVTNIVLLVVWAGVTPEGKEVYLCDIWPSREEVQQTEEDTIISSIFKDLRGRMEVRRRTFITAPVFFHDCVTEATSMCFFFSLPERKHILEQHWMSRFCAFPLGSQVHIYPFTVFLQQVGEFNKDLLVPHVELQLFPVQQQ